MPIDIVIGDKPTPPDKDRNRPTLAGRPYLGIRFNCANGIYTRFYKNLGGSAYEGRCPSCLHPVRIGIGQSGTDSRFFTYDCNRPD